VADEDTYWNWRDVLMRHPEGRAVGGEPCVKCGAPVAPNAYWGYRDRHVCSARCNSNLNRQFNHLVQKASEGGAATWRGLALPGPPPAASNPRQSGPRHFQTKRLLADGAVPYEWEGYCPLPGDTVERHGVTTAYQFIPADPKIPAVRMLHGDLYVAVAPTGHMDIWAANASGEVRRVHWGSFSPAGKRLEGAFMWGEVPLRWSYEFIGDVTPDGFEYRWEAPVAVPIATNHRQTWWSPAYRAASERKKRISSSAARHERRVRVSRDGSERFDPQEVYERDGWSCQLCAQPVDRGIRWPDEMSASLDHIVPLVAGGLHMRGNTQLAHLLCNIRKGARTSRLS